jgi:hypothetical protein
MHPEKSPSPKNSLTDDEAREFIRQADEIIEKYDKLVIPDADDHFKASACGTSPCAKKEDGRG